MSIYFHVLYLILSLSLWNCSVLAVFNFSNRNSTIKINIGGKFQVNSAATNWQGTLDQRGIVNGSIFFNDGMFNIQRTRSQFDSAYSTTASQPILLTGNKSIRIESGIFDKKMLVSSTGNRLEGQVLFFHHFAEGQIKLDGVQARAGDNHRSAPSLNGVQGLLQKVVEHDARLLLDGVRGYVHIGGEQTEIGRASCRERV